MREIKFRIYEGGKMRTWEQLKDHYHQLLVGLMAKPSEDGEYVLMQFTGLHDKNGKEIYESDIISKSKKEQTYKYKVEFVEGCFGVQTKNYGWHNLNTFATIEIIGNIYENPQLLNPKDI